MSCGFDAELRVSSFPGGSGSGSRLSRFSLIRRRRGSAWGSEDLESAPLRGEAAHFLRIPDNLAVKNCAYNSRPPRVQVKDGANACDGWIRDSAGLNSAAEKMSLSAGRVENQTSSPSGLTALLA